MLAAKLTIAALVTVSMCVRNRAGMRTSCAAGGMTRHVVTGPQSSSPMETLSSVRMNVLSGNETRPTRSIV